MFGLVQTRKSSPYFVRVLSLACCLCLLAVTCSFLNSDTKAEAQPIQHSIHKVLQEDNVYPFDTLLYVPDMPEGEMTTGFIFYPGADIDYRKYPTLLKNLARRGYLVASCEFAIDYAVTNPAKALSVMKKLMKQYPSVEHWVIGGHSMGGTSASLLTAAAPNVFDGLVLIASVSYIPQSTSLPVLTLRGTRDGIVQNSVYDQYRSNLRGPLTEVSVKGGNHAQWGNYLQSEQDNAPTISRNAQCLQGVAAMDEFFQTYS